MPKEKHTPKHPVSKAAKRVPSSSARPKLKWSDYEWTGKITLPAWSGFRRKFPPGSPIRTERPSTGKVNLSISTPDDEQVEPAPEQLRALDFLVENQREIRDLILKAITKAYPKQLAPWLVWGAAVPEFLCQLPQRFKDVDELKSHIRLENVYVLLGKKSGMAYVGYGFEATWDVEHGLGVVMHGKRIVEMGHEEVAFSG